MYVVITNSIVCELTKCCSLPIAVYLIFWPNCNFFYIIYYIYIIKTVQQVRNFNKQFNCCFSSFVKVQGDKIRHTYNLIKLSFHFIDIMKIQSNNFFTHFIVINNILLKVTGSNFWIAFKMCKISLHTIILSKHLLYSYSSVWSTKSYI